MSKKKAIKNVKKGKDKAMSKEELENTVGGATAIQYGLLAAQVAAMLKK
jgi:hypothetical protein